MSVDKIFHNVVRLVDGQALTVSGGATPTYTSTWYPIDGWGDKVVTVDADVASGTLDLNVFIRYSPLDYYYLNNLSSVTTEHYEQITIKDAQSAVTLTRYDSDDVADLGKPARSACIYVANDSATVAVTSLNVWLEGNS